MENCGENSNLKLLDEMSKYFTILDQFGGLKQRVEVCAIIND